MAKTATSPEPPRRFSAPSNIERDTAGYAKEVAKLNALDDPHAIPTIDPATRGSTTKSYAFNIPSSLRGSDEGNGIITPTRAWHENGRDCYYGRYEFTYPDGAMESGDIVWPFCYDPLSDPFKEPPHPIPVPACRRSDSSFRPTSSCRRSRNPCISSGRARRARRQRRNSGVCAIPFSTNCTASAARIMPRIRLITWMPVLPITRSSSEEPRMHSHVTTSATA